MSNVLIAFLFSIGAATWVGNRFYNRTGRNAQKALGGAAAVFVIAFILMMSVLSLT